MLKQVGSRRWVLAMMALAAMVPWAGSARAAQEDFTLLRAVPEDVFVCVAARETEENAFLHKYWGEVLDAAKKSGVGEELLGLVSAAVGESQKAEMDRLLGKAKALFEAVEWGKLASKEFVFAERLIPAVELPGGGVSMGPPDILLMFRGEAASTPANFDGLVGIVEGVMAEIPHGEGDALPSLVRSERHGARIAEMAFFTFPQHELPWSLTLAQREDVIVVVLGESMSNQVLGLLAGEGSGAALRDTDRFKAGMGKLPKPESAVMFFDMQTLMSPVRKLVELGARSAGGSGGSVGPTGQNPEATQLHRQALDLATAGKHAEALELQKKAHELAPQDTLITYNLACYLARTGAKEEALAAVESAVAGGFSDAQLLGGDEDLESIRGEARFQAAVAKTGGQAANPWPQIAERLLSAVEVLDYVASVEHTDGYSVFSDTYTALRPGAEKNPIYPVFAGHGPLEDFAKFLPAETMSYSVSSGINVAALYTFILDTIRMAGPDGEAALQEWAKLQEAGGVNVEKDILAWIEGPMTTLTLQGGTESILLAKVTDEAKAREKISQFMQFLSKTIAEQGAQNPMLAMLAIRTAPVQDERLAGFEYITVGMSPQPAVWGVAEGHVIFGTTANAVATCLETAKGKHPNARTNERLMAEALAPKGEFCSASLTDMRGLGQQIAGVLGAFSMVSGFVTMAIPEPEARTVVSKVAGMLLKLTPAATKIDFYKSSSSLSTFDGKAWSAQMVTHYFAPNERPSAAAAAATTNGAEAAQ